MVSFITVNYQSHHLLLKLYNSLLAHMNGMDWEWIIVDNYTTDAERARLKESFDTIPNVEIVCLSDNYGFAVANNKGVRFAQYEYLCIINPDVELLESTIPMLINGLTEHPKAHIVAPQLFTEAGVLLENTYPFHTVIDKIKRKILHLYPQPEEIYEDRMIDWAQGSMLFMRKNDYIDVYNGFDERYFLFLEDTDLCKRVHKNGYEVWHIAAAKALHGEKRISRNDTLWQDINDTVFWIQVKSTLQYYIKWWF